MRPVRPVSRSLAPTVSSRRAGRSPQRILLATALILPALTASCREGARPLMAEFDSPAGPSKSLRETFDFLRAAQERKAFLSLRPYVEPVQRDEVVDLLLAVDALEIAQAAMLQAVERSCPGAPRAHPDLTAMMADRLGIFSRHVEVVAQREDHGKGVATVSILVAGRSPPQEVRFRLLDGQWVYVPGPNVEELTETCRALTKALERVTRSLDSAGQVTPREVEEQYHLFLAPSIKRMTEGLHVR